MTDNHKNISWQTSEIRLYEGKAVVSVRITDGVPHVVVQLRLGERKRASFVPILNHLTQ